MDILSSTFLFSLSITGPIFIVLFLGVYLGKRQLINQPFIDTSSKLVFSVTLPIMLFLNISQANFEKSANFSMIATGVLVTIICWFFIEIAAARWVKSDSDRGVLVQGSFRSNMGIFGLAYCLTAYGEQGLTTAALYLAVLTIFYNILSIITLNRALNKNLAISKTLYGIVKNPLIIAIVLALPFSYFNVTVPDFAIRAGEYFANMTLPLALLCIGASLDLKSLRNNSNEAIVACATKLILMPLVTVLTGIYLGFKGIDLGVLLFIACAPTASASYVMVRALGGNSTLAANIIALTSLASLFTTSIAITILSYLKLL
jgi:predicted permease